MQVVTTQPFRLVYTLLEHPLLGCIIEPHVVQVSSNGLLTLTHQRIFAQTANDFASALEEKDYEIIPLLDELELSHLAKRFNTSKKKGLRAKQFFEKVCTQEQIDTLIRPFIEKQLAKAMELLRDRPLYSMGNDNNPASAPIEIASEKSTVLFHFRKNDEGTRYFPTIKYKGERIEFMYKGAHLLVTDPAWMLLGNRLYNFDRDVDGKKLLPFFNKRFIYVPTSAEPAYFQKFVVHLIEKYHVYAEGFDIVTERHRATPVLKMEQIGEDRAQVTLHFKYHKHLFPFEPNKYVSVALEAKDGQYTFKRIKRALKWEASQKEFLEQIGLEHESGPAFQMPALKQPGLGDTIIEDSSSQHEKYRFIEWLNEHMEQLHERNFKVEQTKGVSKYFIGKSDIQFEVKELNDWFDIHALVRFGKFEFPFHRLRDHILKGKRELILPSGEVAIIPEEWFGKFGGLFEHSDSDEQIQLKKHHLGLIYDLPQESSINASLTKKIRNLKDHQTIDSYPLPENFNGTLRPYQQAGYNWFHFLREHGFGGCLADDMGLGKTVQTLALLLKEKQRIATEENVALVQTETVADASGEPQLSLFNQSTAPTTTAPTQYHPTSLVVVPTSLLFNWQKEAAKFAPDLNILVYAGINRTKDPASFVEYDLILSTYGTVRVDIDILQKFFFHYIILDESQSIKNPGSQVARSVKSLKSKHKLILSGTPIENSLMELWSQLSFTSPGLLGGYQFFNDNFVTPIEKQKDQRSIYKLRTLIQPFILRRTKSQVAKDLPDKTEQIVYCEMSEDQEKLYEQVKSDYRNALLKSIKQDGLGKSRFTVVQGLTQLRQLANHPKLTNPDYTGTSGKYEEIKEKVGTAIAEGHKILLFSQFVKQLKIYRNHFDKLGIPYCYLDGSTPTKERQKEVDRFQTDQSIQLFLISLKAGGLGLNLTAADYVFIIDPWWNPAVEKQAEDRTHRIGQTQKVFTYKFITQGSLEEKILALQKKKSELAESLITTESSFIKSLNVDELMALFK